MNQPIAKPLLRELSELCAQRLGLHFPQSRWSDLERGILSAASDLGFSDPVPFLQHLRSSPLTRNELDALASHLTVGETYFYRDRLAFEALETHILPGLIATRRKSEKRLRIWSAGCSTGEEAYSIAIAVSRAIPDLKDWNVTILATDVNPRFLQKASSGLYGDWSFRDGPPWIKERYFARTADDRYQLSAHIRRMVSFAYLNMAEDVYPSLQNNTNALDLIFCRNVLMYFAPDRAKRVIHHLYQALVEDGWFFVSPSEASHTQFSQFVTVAIDNAFFYRKDHRQVLEPEAPSFPLVDTVRLSSSPIPASQEETQEPDQESLPSPALLAREYANEGKLTEARQWCEKAVAADRLNPGLHYLRSTILQELGIIDEAILSLKRALYLDQDFVLAHFSLGNLARRKGKWKEAARHFQNSLSILAKYRPEEVLPESEGLTVARLQEIVESTVLGVTKP